MSSSVAAGGPDSSDFRLQIFPSYPHQLRLTLTALVNSRWRTETGSSYKLVTGGDVSVMSTAKTQFWASPIHFHRYRHRPTSENSIGYKPEVETVPQTVSTNNLATETRYRRDLSDYTYVFGASFSQVYNADLTRRFLHLEIQRWRTYTGSNYNFVTENNIKVILAAWDMSYVCVATEIASMPVSVANLLVLPVLGTVSTSGLYLIVLPLVGQCRCWWIGRALKHCCSR